MRFYRARLGKKSRAWRAWTLTQEEDREVVAAIESARADVVWVGLSTPKQERWMHEHRDRLNVPVLVGVGAAFDFHTGRVAQAPRWMRENGLEWLVRLGSEPRRLWRARLVNRLGIVVAGPLGFFGSGDV